MAYWPQIEGRPDHEEIEKPASNRIFPDDAACASYLMNNRWPAGVECPRCQNTNVHAYPKDFHWQCYEYSLRNVAYRFSVLVGTIFENTNKPLREWFRVIHLMLTSKKGMSALQICRYMGFGSYKTAWLMCHKIRVALGNVEFRKLVGYVEVDETYVGGRRRTSTKAKEDEGISEARAERGSSLSSARCNRKATSSLARLNVPMQRP